MVSEHTENRLLSLKEAVARSGMSTSFFYNNRSWGSLGLNFQKIGGRLRCSEADFEEWLKLRALLEVTKPNVLVDVLFSLAEGVIDDPGLYSGKHPDTFLIFTQRLEGALVGVVDRIRADQSILLRDQMERFTAIARQIEYGFLKSLLEPAQTVFAGVFSESIGRVQKLLFDIMRDEYRKWFREHACTVLEMIRARQWQSMEGKLEAVEAYLTDEEWELSGFDKARRESMVLEAIEGHDAQQEVKREDT